MKRMLFLLFAACISVALRAVNVSYTADESTIFPNPERGFITMLTGHLTQSKPNAVKGKESYLDAHASNDKGTLILVHYYLDNFKSTATLPTAVLNGFDEDMAVLRNKGMKAIIRFSYVDNAQNETASDAPFSIVQQHINQYKSHWQANADVIFCFQAGIVGAWGEWYYTSNYGNKVSTMNSDRRQVVDALLAAVPADRCIQLRTPKFKTSYVNSTQPLSESEAYTGTAKARLGQHNDAFLYDYDNMGTYQDTATEKPWLAQETLYVPIGGETDITDVNKAKKWATYDKTTAEMSRLHWTFIQSGYATQTTDYWRGNGTFDELNRKMGYRYQLVSATLPDQASAGGKANINIKIKNAGYAPLYNERHAYLVLKAAGRQYKIQLQTDPRRWKPNGVVTTVNEQVTIPSDVPSGTYELYLYLPDAYSSIASNPAYAIRFANNNVWEASSGMNKLNASVTIAGSSTPVDPPQDDAILLPATLNKANVSTYSENMSWYNSDYFDFGPEDAANTDRWAEWNVKLQHPGEYLVSAEGYYPNGHQWQFELPNSGAAVYSLPESWGTGNQTETGENVWDLTSVAQGTYTLRAQNIMEWGQPKLKSITIQYNGDLPSDIGSVSQDAPRAAKILQDGNLYILRENRKYTVQGTEVE
ncbi:MAG: DUF4832 domain-containing protein [Paludibacteraceae bacterium]|nr:DUF4832 domain-containing protein [Paludibacteraceae bacterium]